MVIKFWKNKTRILAEDLVK